MKHLDQKREEAAVRQAATDALSPQERLARLDKAGLVAKKERAKLAAKIALRSKKV